MESEDRIAIDRLDMIAKSQGWEKFEERVIGEDIIVSFRRRLSPAALKKRKAAAGAMPGAG